MSHVLKHNVADQIAYFRAYNTDGSAKTDLTSATTGLTLSVFRVGAASVSIASLSDKAADDSTHADGAIRAVGGNLYTIDIPDAATATQVPSIVVRGSYTGGVVEGLEHPIVAYDPAVNYASATKAADIETDTQDLQSRLPSALISGRIDASVGAMAADTVTASALATDAVNEIADAVWDEPYNQHTAAGTFGKLMDLLRKANLTIDGTVTSAITPTTLTFSSDISATTSAYAHAVLLFTSGPLEGENSPIISYNNTNGVFVLEEPLTAAPTAGDEFVVIAGSHVHAIADIQSGLALQTTSLAIKAKTDLITAGQVQIVSPVGAGGNITTPIFIGDDYKASNNRAFKWTIDARTGFSAGTATCRFGGSSEETGDSWNVAGTVTDIGGGEWELSFDLTKTVTAALSPGFYRWSVELVNPGGDEVTEVYNSNANRQAEVRAKQT